MGTRTIYSFIDESSAFHVYKHWDGDCENSKFFIENAFAYAWPLPRFEAEDFSAAFIAGNKKSGGGDVYLSNHNGEVGWLMYKFEIHCRNGVIYITAFSGGEKFIKIFEGSFEDFKKFDESENSVEFIEVK